MPTRRQRRETYPESVRLGLLEDDVDSLYDKAARLDERQDSFDLWRAKVVGFALAGSLVGGLLVGVIDLILKVGGVT